MDVNVRYILVTSCLVCDPGTFGNVSSLGACFDCTPGKRHKIDPLQVPFLFLVSQSVLHVQLELFPTHPTLKENVKVKLVCLNFPECPAGQFSNQTGSTFCYLCQPGTVSPTHWLKLIHKFVSISRQSGCASCAPGQYANVSGLSGCTVCPDGFNTTLTQDGCIPCEIDYFGKAGFCNPCPGTRNFTSFTR